MIFPWPKSEIKKNDINFTNMLLLLNTVIFILFFVNSESEKIKSILFNSSGVEMTAKNYEKYAVNRNDQEHYRQITLNYTSNNLNHRQILTTLAVRDNEFLNSVENQILDGDEVRWKIWLEAIQTYKKNIKDQVLYIMGLSHGNKSALNWITYQFSHMNFWHLFSNMIFLFLIGYWIEAKLGGMILVMLYLFSGIAGGLFYLYFSPKTLIPMVGASGAISGMISFYCFYESRWRTRFFYIIGPGAQQYGAIYLPTLLIVPMFLISDLSSVVSQLPGLTGGVAYSAHIGGALFGGLLALTLRLSFFVGRKTSP